MSTVNGYDTTVYSTPIRRVYRGSTVTVKRTCYVQAVTMYILDISVAGGMTEIRWDLLVDLNKATAASLSKTYTGGGISLVSDGTDGALQFTLAASDTKTLGTGRYYGQISVTISGEVYKFTPHTVDVCDSGDVGE